MTRKQMQTLKQASGSWARAAIAAILTYYMATGDLTPKALLAAASSACLMPMVRYFNPSDPLGR